MQSRERANDDASSRSARRNCFSRRPGAAPGWSSLRNWWTGACAGHRWGTVRNSVRWAMMMKRRESSHGYRERTSGPAPGW
ncbi:hypothetical protein CN155_33685, partial [Sinorhizobium meliloti]